MLGAYVNSRKTPSPSPLGQQSRYSWGKSSNDGLMSSPGLEESPTSDSSPPPVPVHAPSAPRDPDGHYGPLAPPAVPALRNQHSFTNAGSEGDADARMVRESFIANIKSSNMASSQAGRDKSSNFLAPQVKSVSNMSSDNSLNTASTSSSTSSLPGPYTASSRDIRNVTPVGLPGTGHGSSSTSTTPRAAKPDRAKDAEEPLFDSSLASAIFAPAPRGSPKKQAPKRPEIAKRMTNAEFSKLKLQESMASKNGNANDSDSGDEYEDDETDPALLAQKRKAQQEKDAKHAIWRQTMKKDIGDHSVPTPPGRSHSSPNFGFESNSVAGASLSSNEDDEDVPVGLLMAHGFPNKNKHPDPRLSSNSFVGVRPTSQGYLGSKSTYGGPSARPLSSLPPFARALPEDPYLSTTNLTNPVNRQSLGMNTRGVSYAGSVMDTGPINAGPPGGLVGVIAEEERLRSLRRGSPGYNSSYAQQSLQPQQAPQSSRRPQMNTQGSTNSYVGLGTPLEMPGNPYAAGNGMMMQPMFGGNSATDPIAFQHQLQAIYQSQAETNLRFEQLMQNPFAMGQMQMQMGQMGMGHVGSGPFGQMQGMPMAGLPPPQQSRNMRNSQANLLDPRQPRTMSMMSVDPSVRGMSSFAQQQNYTPSIAPSERSNIGHPGRYRPVSTMRDGGSTITAGSTYQPSGTPTMSSNSNFLSATIHSGKKSAQSATQDEDSEWEQHMKARKSRIGK